MAKHEPHPTFPATHVLRQICCGKGGVRGRRNHLHDPTFPATHFLQQICCGKGGVATPAGTPPFPQPTFYDKSVVGNLHDPTFPTTHFLQPICGGKGRFATPARTPPFQQPTFYDKSGVGNLRDPTSPATQFLQQIGGLIGVDWGFAILAFLLTSELELARALVKLIFKKTRSIRLFVLRAISYSLNRGCCLSELKKEGS